MCSNLQETLHIKLFVLLRQESLARKADIVLLVRLSIIILLLTSLIGVITPTTFHLILWVHILRILVIIMI